MRLGSPTIVAALATLTLASGCGSDRTRPVTPDVPLAVSGRSTVDLRAAGLKVRLPDGWLRTTGPAPLLVSAASGPATLAIWRYPRAEPLPQTDAALQDARGTLLAAARARDPTFTATTSRVTRVAGQPAVELRGTGTIDGRRRSLRSVHLYAFDAEIVVDAFAPARDQPALDRDVVAPLLETLEVRRP